MRIATLSLIKTDKPFAALELLRTLNLHALIFGLPANTVDIEPALPSDAAWATMPCRVASLLAQLAEPAAGQLPASLREHLLAALAPADWRRLYLAAALAPMRGITCAEKKRRIWAGERSISESLTVC